MMSQLLPKPCNAEFCCKWAPVVDGVELPQHPYMLAAEGKRAAVPLLLGTNKDEDVSFAAQQLFCTPTRSSVVGQHHGLLCYRNVRLMTLMTLPVWCRQPVGRSVHIMGKRPLQLLDKAIGRAQDDLPTERIPAHSRLLVSSTRPLRARVICCLFRDVSRACSCE